MKSSDTIRKVISPFFTVQIKGWIQIPFIFNIFPITVIVRDHTLVIRGHFTIQASGGSGVNTRGAGEGKPFVHGEIGEGEFSGQGGS